MREWAGTRRVRRAGFGQAALIMGLGLCGAPHSARASSTYPAQVQLTMSKRLNASYCVPQCVLCHRTNEGGLGTMNSFGKSLETNVHLLPMLPGTVETRLEAYFSDYAELDTDGDGISDVKELEVGDSPAIADDPGKNLICPDITYGCGARIAPKPVSSGPWSAVLMALGLALLGFRRRLARATRALGLPLK